MQKAITISSSAILIVMVALLLQPITLAGQNAAPPATADAGKTAEQVFKNIQALKGTPADDLLPAMQFIANSLGVQCEFCHVRDANEKDDKKEKQTARKMIEMQMAINRANFKGENEVTCFSCHRGAHDPVGVPIIAEQEANRPEPEKTQLPPLGAPSADQILDKYVQAVGGADALQKITTRIEKGTITFAGRQFPIDVAAKAPNKRMTAVHTPNGDNITAFDGRNGWLGNPGGRPPRDMTAAELDAVNFDSNFSLPTELKKMFTELRVRPAEKIGGKEVLQVIGLKQGKPPLRLFFEKESGLLVRSIRYAETPLGRNPTQVDYADYRGESGVKIPFQWTVARPLARFTIQITEAQHNVAIDDSKFAKPGVQIPATK